MPRVTIKKQQYMVSDLNRFIREKMYEKKITQAHMAKLLGIAQSSFSVKLRDSAFNYIQLIKIFKELKASDEEILRAMRL